MVSEAVGEDARALRAEGERLRIASHPGVIELVSSRGSADRWELRVVHGGRPVETVGPLPGKRVASIAAEAAETLAELHDRGIVHGHIGPSSVLISSTGRVVLGGFGSPASVRGLTPADDVAAIGALIGELLGSSAEPRARVLGPKDPIVSSRRLRAVASLAVEEPPERRPSARRLAQLLRACAGPEGPVRPRHLGGRRPIARWCRFAVGASGAVSLAWLGSVAFTGSGPGSGLRDAGGAPSDHGEVVVFDGRRFAIGERGDSVLVGDWDCDGTSTPIALRGSTGEVFVFPRWAVEHDLVVAATTTITGAAKWAPTTACGAPRVVTHDGRVVTVDVGEQP